MYLPVICYIKGLFGIQSVPACKLLYTGTLLQTQCTSPFWSKYRDFLEQSVSAFKGFIQVLFGLLCVPACKLLYTGTFCLNMHLPIIGYVQGLFDRQVYLPIYYYVLRNFGIINVPACN